MSKIDDYIIESFKKVKDEDLPEDINERSFVFRMGHYLANYIENDYEFRNYKVDVEYNRKNYNPKRKESNLIIPDLVIHKRLKKYNLVAIEFKKSIDSKKDRNKLEFLKNDKDYLYNHVYFIIINKNKIEKYIDGNWKKIIGDNYE